jgi:uncharacterized protein YcnI
MRSILTSAVLALGVLFATSAVASAHVGMSVDNTAAGAFVNARVSVPHGCEGKGTTKISIAFDHDQAYVTPYEAAGWESAVEMTKLDEPMEAAHGEVTEVVSEVSYTRTGAALPDGTGSAMYISMQLPEDAAGESLAYPIIQECEGGLQTDWVEVAAEGEDPHELDKPAALVEVTEAGDDDHGAAADDDADDDDDDKAGDAAATVEWVDARIDKVRFMAWVGAFLGAMALILSLLNLLARIRENKESGGKS